MYEYNGKEYSLQQIAQAAIKSRLSLEDYIKKHGITKKATTQPVDINTLESESAHISRDDFNFRGEDAERVVVERLQKRYPKEEYGIEFNESVPMLDYVRVRNSKGESERIPLNTDWNFGEGGEGRYGDPYTRVINFIENSKKNEDPIEKKVFGKLGTNYGVPDLYPKFQTDETEAIVGASGEISHYKIQERTSTAEEVYNATTYIEDEIRKSRRTPQEYGLNIAKSSTDSQYELNNSQRKQERDAVYSNFMNNNPWGYKMAKDEFLKIYDQRYGVIQQEEIQKEDFENTILEKNLITNKKYIQDWERSANISLARQFGVSQEVLTNILELKDNIKESQTRIQDLKDKKLLPDADIAGIENLITAENRKINSYVEQINEKAWKTKTRSDFVEPGVAPKYEIYQEFNEDLANVFMNDGFSENSSNEMQDSYNVTANTIALNNMLEQVMLDNPMMTMGEAGDKLYEANWKHHEALLNEGNRTVTLDFSNYNDRNTQNRDGRILNPYNDLLTKLNFPLGPGVYEVPYNDLHKAGITTRRFDSWWKDRGAGGFGHDVINEEDLTFVEQLDQAHNRNIGERHALYNLFKVQRDPSKIEKRGGLGAFVNTATKSILTAFVDIPEAEADRIVANLGGKKQTTRYLLDTMQSVQHDYNNIFQEEIKSGSLQALEWNEDQVENFERTWGENIGEGVGHFVPELIKLGIISAATGGVMTWAGATRYLKLLKEGGKFKFITGAEKTLKGAEALTGKAKLWNNILYHGTKVMLEEAKMSLAGFKPTSGAAFYTGGVLTQGLTPFKPGSRFSWLNPLWQKVLKGGPVGAASMEFATITEAAWDDLMDNADFKTHFNELFGDFDEVTKRFITNSIVFGIVGAQHIKKTDFMTSEAKNRAGAALQLKALQMLGYGKKGRNRKLENLSEKERDKFNSYVTASQNLFNMARVEKFGKDLDPKSKNFEVEMAKRYEQPVNNALKAVIPGFKGITWKYYEGGKFKHKKHLFENKEHAAEFHPDMGKNGGILIDKSKFTPGKPIHEVVHAALDGWMKAQPRGFERRLNANLSKIFTKYDLKAEYDGIEIGPLKDFIDAAYAGKTGEMKANEFLAYMAEFFTDGKIYASKVTRNAVEDIMQEFRDIYEENFQGMPYSKIKIKTAGDFVRFLGRLSQGARRGTDITEKIKVLAQLDKIELQGLTNAEGGRSKKGMQPSKDLIAERDRLLKENLKLVKEKPEGWREQNKIIAAQIRGIDSSILMSETNEKEILKYKELVDKGIDPSVHFSRLRENNMGILNEFVKEAYKDVPGSDVTFKMFEGYTKNNELNKIINSYLKKGKVDADGNVGLSPMERGVPFGAYLRNTLFGPNYVTGSGRPQRQGNILRALQGGRTQDQTIKTVSIEAEGVRSEAMQLVDGTPMVLDGGTTRGGSNGPKQVEAGLILLKEKLGLSPKHIKAIEAKIEASKLSEANYRDLIDLTPDLTLEIFGGIKEYVTKKGVTKPVVFGKSAKNVEQKAEYIAEKWETLYDLLPHGAMLKTGRNQIEGLSTEIRDPLLNGLLYTPITRKGKDAQASAAKTGKTSGLPVQNKIKNLTKEQFLEKFGIFLNAEGKVDFNKTNIKSQSKNLRAIDALITETGRAITNQTVRLWLTKKNEKGELINKELYDKLNGDALLDQIAGGKSASLASRDLLLELQKKGIGTNDRSRIQLIQRYISNPKLFAENNSKAFKIIKDEIHNILALKAEQGVSNKGYTEKIKAHPEYGEIYKNGYASLSSKKFKENEVAVEQFIKHAVEMFTIIPDVSLIKQSGNLKMLFDLAAGHYSVVGSTLAKTKKGQEGAFRKAIMDALATKFDKVKNKEHKNILKEELPKELVERWRKIDWDFLSKSSAYSSETWGNVHKVWQAGIEGGGQKIAREIFTKKESKILLELFDLWNSTLQHWIQNVPKQKSEAKYKEIRDGRLSYMFKLNKANGEIGTTGARVLAPNGYMMILPKNFFDTKVFKEKVDQMIEDGGYVGVKGNFISLKRKTPESRKAEAQKKVFEQMRKFEHLKSSSDMSFDSAILIADGLWTTKGQQALRKYRGIYGLLSEFNMIDTSIIDGKKVDAKVSNADIFRFGKNLELAKHIYSAKSGFRKSLYQEMIEGAGKKEVLRLEKALEAYKLDRALEIAKDPNKKRKGISIFDFDQTLANTKEKVKVIPLEGKPFRINAAEFAKRAEALEAKGAKFDFSEFEKVIGAKKGPLFDLAMKRQGKFGSGDIFVLTARPQSSALAIHNFLKGIGLNIPVENITGLESGAPRAKADFVLDKVIEKYNDFYFADDAIKNVKAVKRILDVVDVKSDVQQAFAAKDMNVVFNEILEGKFNIGKHKIYSKAKARVVGKGKGRFKVWIPYSAEDFTGLLYPILRKGKNGDADFAFLKHNLIDPFARGERNMTQEKFAIQRDHRELKKRIPSVAGKGGLLKKKIVDSDGKKEAYTYEEAARVYVWDKMGYKIPDLTKTDLNMLKRTVKSNSDLRDFADGLITIHKADGYVQPSKSWLAGTITTDIMDGLNKNKRAKHLKEFNNNVDIIFSEANMNKLEAALGKNWREAMENILERMKSGQNRKVFNNTYMQKMENQLLDWANNSVGTIMFLNSKSALLQTLSMVNYINMTDNNPMKAAMAFGNQKQFWKDFISIYNSSYLVQRREGVKLNINEAEIVEAASREKGINGVISYMLKQGFLLTRHADSFAIAMGGASFFRNRYNTYVNQGLSKKAAKKKAFLEFREISEETQQSSRADKISAQQASGLGRVILAFANTPMQYARLQKRAIQDLVAGRGDARTNTSKAMYYGFIANLIFNTIQQAAWAIKFDENEDDEKQIFDKSADILNGTLDSSLRGFGYQGAALAAGKNVLYKMWKESREDRPKYEDAAWEFLKFSPPISSKILKVRSALRALDYDLDEMKEGGFGLENPAWMAGAQLLSGVTNAPFDRILMKMDNIQNAFAEDTEMWARPALLAGYNDWTLGIDERSKERFRKAKKEKELETRRRFNMNKDPNIIDWENIDYDFEDIDYDELFEQYD